MPDLNPRPGEVSKVAQGPAFDKLGGFNDFINVHSEGRDRNNSAQNITIRYGRFIGWRYATSTGQPQLARIDIGGGNELVVPTVESNLTGTGIPGQGDRVIVLTWGVAHGVVLGKLLIQTVLP